MAEIYDEESLLGDTDGRKKVEVVPEMLDYEFVAGCQSTDELRAILKALRSGEYGRYPDLESTVKTKLIDLLPEKETKKIVAITAKPSMTEVTGERESLQDWLDDLSKGYEPSSWTGDAPGGAGNTTAPVRAVTHTDLGKGETKPNEESLPPKAKTDVFRKEKLSTKEYFDRWDNYDVDDALDSSDDEAKIEVDEKYAGKEAEEQRAQQRKDELLQLKASLSGLTQAERNFMATREREKGNECFNANDNDEAIACYNKSIVLDENAKTYSNRAVAFMRQSQFDEAITDCSKALEIDPTFLKARLRRAMCYHKLEQYEDAIADFNVCHEMDRKAGYDKLLQKSQEKLREKRNKFHKMVIREVDGSADIADCIEEVYTPGALEAELQQNAAQNDRSTQRKETPMVSGSSTRNTSGSSESKSCATDPNITKDSEAWTKISIVETSDIDGDEEADIAQRMRRIDIVEESDSEEEDERKLAMPKNGVLSAGDSEKLKDDGNQAMKHHRYDDAVQLYSLSLEANPNNSATMNNRSLAYLKLKQWGKSIADASSCLEMDQANTKALYRRGFARMMQCQDEQSIKEAQDDFDLALSYQPPKEQMAALTGKVDECLKILSCLKQKGKKKARSYDTQALAF